jgi:hypothetical protein
MSNDAERLQCLILKFTNTMQNLFSNNLEEYLRIVDKIQDWDKFQTIEDYINLNNKYINKALIELVQDEKVLKILKEETNIDTSKISKLL